MSDDVLFSPPRGHTTILYGPSPCEAAFALRMLGMLANKQAFQVPELALSHHLRLTIQSTQRPTTPLAKMPKRITHQSFRIQLSCPCCISGINRRVTHFALHQMCRSSTGTKHSGPIRKTPHPTARTARQPRTRLGHHEPLPQVYNGEK